MLFELLLKLFQVEVGVLTAFLSPSPPDFRDVLWNDLALLWPLVDRMHCHLLCKVTVPPGLMMTVLLLVCDWAGSRMKLYISSLWQGSGAMLHIQEVIRHQARVCWAATL